MVIFNSFPTHFHHIFIPVIFSFWKSLILGWYMVFNATFNNISVISWRSVLLVEEIGVPRENHWPVTSHWQTLSDNWVHLVMNLPRISWFSLEFSDFPMGFHLSFWICTCVSWFALKFPDLHLSSWIWPWVSDLHLNFLICTWVSWIALQFPDLHFCFLNCPKVSRFALPFPDMHLSFLNCPQVSRFALPFPELP